MRRDRRDNSKARSYGLIVLLALVLPVGINLLWSSWAGLAAWGEQAAALAAALNMPDSALELIRERFESELYTPQSPVPALPALPVPGQDSSRQEPEAESAREPETSAGDSGTPIAPKIPAQYRAQLLSENFSGAEGGDNIRFGAGLLRNDTRMTTDEVAQLLETPMELSFPDTNAPLVLIYHTHATESFERYDNTVYDTRNTWRSSDNNNNMVAVGAAMAQVLEENGIGVIHDTTQHDYPSYNGSYERSAETISAYLEQYPTICVILDLHRDAMERENSVIIKPVAEVGGKKAAQIMIIAGSDNGSMNMPDWRENMRFAAAYQDAMEAAYPGLTRPILLSYRKYNQHLSTGALLLEFGSNANTLDEAVYSAQMAGQALADLIYAHME